MDEKHPSCIDCGTAACRGKGGALPPFCTTARLDEALLNRSLEIIRSEESDFFVASAVNERDSYGKRTRIEETMHFAQLLGVRKLGIATCAGLIGEARALARVFRAHGYEVTGIACKCGMVKKTDMGIPERCMECGENICNPVLQALFLAREKTELNIALGLCVGHDSLFYKYSEAPVTTLSSKDRVLCHATLGPLYQLDGYWKRLLRPDDFLTAPAADGAAEENG